MCLQGQGLSVSVGTCVIVRMKVLYLGIVCMCVLPCVESAQIFTGVSGYIPGMVCRGACAHMWQ